MNKNFLTPFPNFLNYKPNYYIIDATNKTLGRLSTLVSQLLRSKQIPYFSSNIDLGNFVIIINANKINISGKKKMQKFYFRQTQRPGSLKKISFNDLQKKASYRILEKAIYGMLPRGIVGKKYYSRLFIYNESNIDLKKGTNYEMVLKNINFTFL
jgi:large subunit ribosomal protein L13